MTPAKMTTFTGKIVDLLNFKVSDVDIKDIAHHLACINRFNGAARVPVSVAQHSVYVHQVIKNLNTTGRNWPEELQALLHDASEAYIGDMTKWLKHSEGMRAFRELEDHIQGCVYEAFGLPPWLFPSVKKVDDLMVRFEALRSFDEYPLLKATGNAYYDVPTAEEIALVDTAMSENWIPWSWKIAEERFLYTFDAAVNR